MKSKAVLVWVSIAVKRHHDSYKEHLGGAAVTVSEVESIIVMVGSVASCRQTWCWRSQEFYILNQNQQGDSLLQAAGGRSLSHWVELEHRTSKPTLTVTHFLQ